MDLSLNKKKTSRIEFSNLCSEIMQEPPLSSPSPKQYNKFRAIGTGISGIAHNNISEKEREEIIEKFVRMDKEHREAERRREALREKFVDHLLEVDWIVNYDYIQEQKKMNPKEHYNPNDVDMETMVSGKYKNDYHLISHCGNYTVRVKLDTVVFWQKDPEWIQLAELEIQNIQFTNKGIKVGILKIEL